MKEMLTTAGILVVFVAYAIAVGIDSQRPKDTTIGGKKEAFKSGLNKARAKTNRDKKRGNL